MCEKSPHRSGFLLSFSGPLNSLALREVCDLFSPSFAPNGTVSNEGAIVLVKEVFYIVFIFASCSQRLKKKKVAVEAEYVNRGRG